MLFVKTLRNILQKDFKKNTDGKSIDIIANAFPCQSYSLAGRRKIEDERNFLFEEVVKYVKFFNPKSILIENVIGILSKKTADGSKIIDKILSNFTEYNIKVCKLYASDFGVPQNRRRVIIIGIRNDLGIIPEEPIPTVEERIPV